MTYLQPRLQALFTYISSNFFEDRRRLFLWCPVFLSIGIITFVILPFNPPLWLGISSLAITLTLIFSTRRWPLINIALLGFCLITLGFTLIQGKAHWLQTPMLTQETGPVMVTGTVIEVEKAGRKGRILLQVDETDPPIPLKLVRYFAKNTKKSPLPPLTPGTRIRAQITLSPISPPLIANGFHFRRKAFFEGLSAYGFPTTTPLEILHEPDNQTLSQWLRNIRSTITNKIHVALGKRQGAIGAALITGEKAAITQKDRDAYANAGIAHILAISGLHLSLVAGFVFVLIRLMLSLIPTISLRYNTKKLAAIFAIAVTFSYLMISGLAVPAQRAFIMTLIVMLATLTDRQALSMRSVSLAAFGILLIFPQVLLTPSFQLSFAAVISLIAFYEGSARAFTNHLKDTETHSVTRKLLLYAAGVMVTTTIATIATTPFTIYHFGHFTAQSLLSNLVVIPLMGFWIMPLGFINLMLMPFGLETYPLQAMGWGIDVSTQIAYLVSSWPGANIPTPKPAPWVMAMVTLSALWLCFWKSRWRFLSLPTLTAGLVLFFIPNPNLQPDVVISPDGRLIGVLTTDRILFVSAYRHNRFTRKVWESTLAPLETRLFPYEDSHEDLFSCEELYCTLHKNGETLHIAQFPYALKKALKTGKKVLDASASSKTSRTVFLKETPVNGASLWITHSNHKTPPDRPWR